MFHFSELGEHLRQVTRFTGHGQVSTTILVAIGKLERQVGEGLVCARHVATLATRHLRKGKRIKTRDRKETRGMVKVSQYLTRDMRTK